MCAEDAVRAVARSVHRLSPRARAAGIGSDLALFHAYVARAWPTAADSGLTARRILEAADGVGAGGMAPTLFDGYVGVAWAVEHLRGWALPQIDGDPNEEIDASLRALLGRPWSGPWDLTHGLVGLGVYALERRPRHGALELLARVVERLGDLAERTPEGVTWRSPPDLLPPHLRQTAPGGWHNLGTAHGVPGVVALLGRACATPSARAARPILAEAVRWLLAQRLPPGARTCFPYAVGPGLEPTESRLAWCYGDPGIAATLLVAARCAGEPAWEREALAIARAAAAREVGGADVPDASLCHGAAGLGHMFNRLYRATGEPSLLDTARAWFRAALAWRRPRRGIAGFPSFSWASESSPVRWRPDPGLLQGATGVGLALLAAVTPIEPEWDRLLLLSSPTVGDGQER